MFSIIIPSLNNLNYLRLCIESINKNSLYGHEIIVHVNRGDDGTINFLNENIYFYYSTFFYAFTKISGNIFKLCRL